MLLRSNDEHKNNLEPVDSGDNAQNSPVDTKSGASNEAAVEQTAQSAFSGYEVGFSKIALIYLGIQVALFMTLMESTIVSTSVIAITNGLGGYVKSSWLFTSYMLTFSGFPIIWAKASDIVGRKPCLLAALIVFLVFSAACGAAQTLIQLIMFRWLQGIGASGVFSLTLVFFELIPPEKYAISTSVTNMVVSLSFLTGPLVGGAVTLTGKWRWIFLMNVPVTSVALVILFFAFPKQLSREPVANRAAESVIQRLKRFDVLGGMLLLGITVSLTTALQQAAQGIAFSSAFVWPLLLVAGLSLLGFLSWQRYITTKRRFPEPVLPWRFLQNRACVGIMLNTYFSGSVMTICVVQIPQRFIVLNNMSPLGAGTRLLAFSLMVPVGSIFAAVLLDRKLLSPNALLLTGGTLQTIGVTLFATLASDTDKLGPQYGYQVIVGIGLGFVTTATFLLIPMKMERRDLAVGTGMVAQFRILGGVISLAIVTCISTPVIRNALLEFISPEHTHAILDRLETIGTLPKELQAQVRDSFRRGFDLQMTIAIGFAAANILATVSMMGKDMFLEDLRFFTSKKESTSG
ncbi:MFS general substrate transporter [Paraphaeosphaeria sporulosa]|uniref:MFS general substrate transporter n=1 Tax=Paraphaeosphaeria sporulosa TaxID=1460663 RepID=A0A177CZW1_9PLEO|nr:MFS general substrate transporter [Paraphaeosphaeria sporulosa]OAG12507.1 MFS general substrate transporter [Paraphaeosphaeria sporulosa]